MYKIHTIWSVCIIYSFEFSFKRTLTLFFFIQTNFIKIVQLVFIDFIVNVLVYLIIHASFLFSCRKIS